jgi:hypothetical protein
MSEEAATIQELTEKAQKGMAKEAAAAARQAAKKAGGPKAAQGNEKAEASKGGQPADPAAKDGNDGGKKDGKKDKAKPADTWGPGELNHRKEKGDKSPHSLIALFWRYEEKDGHKSKLSFLQRWERGAAVGKYYSDKVKKYFTDHKVSSARDEIYKADEADRLADARRDYFPKDADGKPIPLNLEQVAEAEALRNASNQKATSAPEASIAPVAADAAAPKGASQGQHAAQATQPAAGQDAARSAVAPEAATTPAMSGQAPSQAAADASPAAEIADRSAAQDQSVAQAPASSQPVTPSVMASQPASVSATPSLSLGQAQDDAGRKAALTDRVHDKAQEKFERLQDSAPKTEASRAQRRSDEVEM